MTRSRAVSVCLGVIATAVAFYGAYLLATVGDEFDPRGRVGICALVVAVVVGGLASLAWRRSR